MVFKEASGGQCPQQAVWLSVAPSSWGFCPCRCRGDLTYRAPVLPGHRDYTPMSHHGLLVSKLRATFFPSLRVRGMMEDKVDAVCPCVNPADLCAWACWRAQLWSLAVSPDRLSCSQVLFLDKTLPLQNPGISSRERGLSFLPERLHDNLHKYQLAAVEA